MKRRAIIITVIVGLGVLVVFGLDWHFFMLTGRFTPKKIVDTLSARVSIASVGDSGLMTQDGRIIRLPGVSNIVAPASVARDITEHGVEVQLDGTVYALIRVHHWCGNDPVRFHLARLDLSSLFLVLGEQKQARTTEYGINPGVYGMATIRHEDLKELIYKTNRPDGTDNSRQAEQLIRQ